MLIGYARTSTVEWMAGLKAAARSHAVLQPPFPLSSLDARRDSTQSREPLQPTQQSCPPPPQLWTCDSRDLCHMASNVVSPRRRHGAGG